MTETIISPFKDLLVEKLTFYLEVYICPDVFIILDPLENILSWYQLSFSDENDSIIYETKINLSSIDSIKVDALKSIDITTQKDERYVHGTLFQELADALSMHQGIFGDNDLVTIINNHLPYINEIPGQSASFDSEMNSYLAFAMGIENAPAYLCEIDNKCTFTDSLYTWIMNLYNQQNHISDNDGIWTHLPGTSLCPIAFNGSITTQ